MFLFPIQFKVYTIRLQCKQKQIVQNATKPILYGVHKTITPVTSCLQMSLLLLQVLSRGINICRDKTDTQLQSAVWEQREREFSRVTTQDNARASLYLQSVGGARHLQQGWRVGGLSTGGPTLMTSLLLNTSTRSLNSCLLLFSTSRYKYSCQFNCASREPLRLGH